MEDQPGWWQVDLRKDGEPITDLAEAKKAVAALGLGTAEVDADEDGPQYGIWMVQIPDERIPKIGDPERFIDAHYAGWTDGEYEISIPLP